jgi:hypothetical protein
LEGQRRRQFLRIVSMELGRYRPLNAGFAREL